MVDLDGMLRALADEPLAPPAPLPELERRVSVYRRRRSGALGSFRVDPAPSSLQPRLTEAQVLAAFGCKRRRTSSV